MDDLRKKFAVSIANRIDKEFSKREHARQDKQNSSIQDSFIFGLLGSWGEGKTTFLNKFLAPEIKARVNHQIPVTIQAWKYSHDRVAFLRYFISTIAEVKVDGGNKKEIDAILDRMKYGQNKLQWNIAYLKKAICYVIIGLIGYSIGWLLAKFVLYDYHYFFINIYSFFQPLYPLLSSLGILGLLASFISKSVSITTTIPSSNTMDEFEEAVDKLLSEDERLVVFIDDLDRVNRVEARNIIDNIRTFFNDPRIAFVICIDSSVLEKYFGSELLPSATLSEQVDEGRRFLKKIFDVSWRLPIPLETATYEYIDSVIADTQVADCFSEENTQLEIFREQLYSFFNKNYREIERFCSTFLMQYQIVDYLYNNDDGDRYFEIKQNPLLLVRILLYQEFANPVYQLLIKGELDILKFEIECEKNNYQVAESVFNRCGIKEIDLTNAQWNALNKIATADQKFYSDGISNIQRPQILLYYNAEEDVPLRGGLVDTEFTAQVNTQSVDDLAKKISLTGIAMLNACASRFVKEFNQRYKIVSNREKYLDSAIETLTTVLAALNRVGDKDRDSRFIQYFEDLDISFISEAELVQKYSFYIEYWKLLDRNSLSIDVEKFKLKFPYKSYGEYKELDLNQEMATFSSSLIVSWFCKAYTQQENETTISFFLELAEKLDKKTIRDFFQRGDYDERLNIESLVNGIEENPSVHINRIKLLVEYYPDSKAILKQRFLENVQKSIEKNSHSMWTVVYEKPDIFDDAVKYQDLFDELIKLIGSRVNVNFFEKTLMFLNEEFERREIDLDELWNQVYEHTPQVVYDYLDKVIDNSKYTVLNPSNSSANQLFSKLAEHFNSTSELPVKNRISNMLQKDRWLWKETEFLDFDQLIVTENDQNHALIQSISQLKKDWD